MPDLTEYGSRQKPEYNGLSHSDERRSHRSDICDGISDWLFTMGVENGICRICNKVEDELDFVFENPAKLIHSDERIEQLEYLANMPYGVGIKSVK